MSSTLRTGLAAAAAVAALAVAAVLVVALRPPEKPARPADPPPAAARAPELPPYRSPKQAPLPTPPTEVEDTGALVEATLAPSAGRVETPPPPVSGSDVKLPPVNRAADSPFKPVPKPKAKDDASTRIEAKPGDPARPPLEPGKLVYGSYHKQSIEGFTVYVSETTFEQSDRARGRPLDMLQQELADIARVVPPRLLEKLRKVKVFVEWDHVLPGMRDNSVLAAFYGGRGEFLLLTGILPQKAGHITVFSLKAIVEEKEKLGERKKEIVLLHEMAHAVHHYALGSDNPYVMNAYIQAMGRRLYHDVEDAFGHKRRAYAATNDHEYFAELTTAYLDRCNYYPFDRDQLREYDSVGYGLMKSVWGEPDRLKPKKDKKN